MLTVVQTFVAVRVVDARIGPEGGLGNGLRVEPTQVVILRGADGSNGIEQIDVVGWGRWVGRFCFAVVITFGENMFVGLVGFVLQKRPKALAVEGGGHGSTCHVEQGGGEIDVGNQAIKAIALLHVFGQAHGQGDGGAAFVKRALGAARGFMRQGNAVVGGEDNERVVGVLRIVEKGNEVAPLLVEVANGGLKVGHEASVGAIVFKIRRDVCLVGGGGPAVT